MGIYLLHLDSGKNRKKNKEQLPLCISPFLVKRTNSPKECAIHVSEKLSFGGRTVIVYSYLISEISISHLSNFRMSKDVDL